MSFPHPQACKDKDGNEDKSNKRRIIRDLVKRTIDVTEYRDAEHKVNPAKKGACHDVTPWIWSQRRTALCTQRATVASLRTSSRRDQPGGRQDFPPEDDPSHQNKRASRQHPWRCSGDRCWSTVSFACHHEMARVPIAYHCHPTCTRARSEPQLSSQLFRLRAGWVPLR